MTELMIEYHAKAFEKKGKNAVVLANRQSPKNGASFRKFMESIDAFWMDIVKANIPELYIGGLLDDEITNKRLMYIRTKGKMGLSRAEALQRYKRIYSLLPENILNNRRKTFDDFTAKELGLEVHK